MKNYLLVLVCLFLFYSSYCQTYQYIPISTNNAVWKATNYTAVMRGANCGKYQYKLSGAYTVSGVDTFFKVEMLGAYMSYDIYHSTPEQIEFVNTCSSRPFEYPIEAGNSIPGIYWMIEKDKRVYVLDSPSLDTSVHKPNVDFNIDSVGQIINNGLYRDTVTSIDTININGTLRKRIVLKGYPAYTVMQSLDTLIEGIGSLRFGLGFKPLTAVGLDDMAHGKVFCFSVNNQQEYVYNNSACADIWPLNVDNILTDTRFMFGPNPFSHQLTYNAPADATLRIYNILGACVCTHTSSRGEKIVIETSAWQPGVYMAITESKGSRNASRLVKL